MKYRVYKITDPNGLVYIGCTKKSLRQRFSGSYNKRLTEAMKKYGKANFTIEELHVCESSLLARKLETLAIRRHQSTNPDKGYNIDKDSDYPVCGFLEEAETFPITIDCISEEEVDAVKRLHQQYVSGRVAKAPTPITFVPKQPTSLERTLKSKPTIGISVEEFMKSLPSAKQSEIKDQDARDNDECVFDGYNIPLPRNDKVFEGDWLTPTINESIARSYVALGYKRGDIMSKKAVRARCLEVKRCCEMGC